MRGFVRVGGQFQASLDDLERRVLAGVVADVAGLLGASFGRDDGLDEGRGDGRGDGGRDDGRGDGGRAGDPFAADWPAQAPDAPEDPAVARLLPPASRDDAELAAEFRRLSEADVRATKVASLRLVWESLRAGTGVMSVAEADAPRWAAAITDVRLVLADRLGIVTEEDAERVYEAAGADDEADAALATVYTVLTWLQETLLQAILDGVDGVGREGGGDLGAGAGPLG